MLLFCLQVEAQLGSLPQALSADKALELRMLLTRLSNTIKSAVRPPSSASGDSIAFFRAADKKYHELRSAILAARPRVQLFDEMDNTEQPDQVQKDTAGEEDVAFWLAQSAKDSNNGDSSIDDGSATMVITLDEARSLAEVCCSCH